MSKSVDDFNKQIADYEITCSVLHDKLVKILRYSFSPYVIEDFEYIIRTETLLKLNFIPRDISELENINERYSMLYKDSNIRKKKSASIN
jgi:hypothetical protein